MLGSRLMLCGGCHLLWFPEKGTGAEACPACRGKSRRIPQLFHLGMLVMAAGLALGAVQLSRGSAPFATRPGAGTAAAPAARAGPRVQAPRTARVNAKLVLEVTSGPRRGGTVTLKRGEKVSVLKKERGALLVEDRKGNRMWVKQDQITPL